MNKNNLPCFKLLVLQETYNDDTKCEHLKKTVSEKISLSENVDSTACKRFIEVSKMVELPSSNHLTHSGSKFSFTTNGKKHISTSTITCLIKADLFMEVGKQSMSHSRHYAITCAHCILPCTPNDVQFYNAPDTSTVVRPLPPPSIESKHEQIHEKMDVPRYRISEKFTPMWLFSANYPWRSRDMEMMKFDKYQVPPDEADGTYHPPILEMEYLCSRFGVFSGKSDIPQMCLNNCWEDSTNHFYHENGDVNFTVDFGVLKIVQPHISACEGTKWPVGGSQSINGKCLKSIPAKSEQSRDMTNPMSPMNVTQHNKDISLRVNQAYKHVQRNRSDKFPKIDGAQVHMEVVISRQLIDKFTKNPTVLAAIFLKAIQSKHKELDTNILTRLLENIRQLAQHFTAIITQFCVSIEKYPSGETTSQENPLASMLDHLYNNLTKVEDEIKSITTPNPAIDYTCINDNTPNKDAESCKRVANTLHESFQICDDSISMLIESPLRMLIKALDKMKNLEVTQRINRVDRSELKNEASNLKSQKDRKTADSDEHNSPRQPKRLDIPTDIKYSKSPCYQNPGIPDLENEMELDSMVQIENEMELDSMVQIWENARNSANGFELLLVTNGKIKSIPLPQNFYFEVNIRAPNNPEHIIKLPVIKFEKPSEKASSTETEQGEKFIVKGDSGSPLFLVPKSEDTGYFLGNVCGGDAATRWDIGINSVAPEILWDLLDNFRRHPKTSITIATDTTDMTLFSSLARDVSAKLNKRYRPNIRDIDEIDSLPWSFNSVLNTEGIVEQTSVTLRIRPCFKPCRRLPRDIDTIIGKKFT